MVYYAVKRSFGMKSQGMTIQLNAIEQYFPVVMFIFYTRWFYLINSTDEILECIKPFKLNQLNWTLIQCCLPWVLFFGHQPEWKEFRREFKSNFINYSRWREKHFRKLTRIVNQSCIDADWRKNFEAIVRYWAHTRGCSIFTISKTNIKNHSKSKALSTTNGRPLLDHYFEWENRKYNEKISVFFGHTNWTKDQLFTISFVQSTEPCHACCVAISLLLISET